MSHYTKADHNLKITRYIYIWSFASCSLQNGGFGTVDMSGSHCYVYDKDASGGGDKQT